MSAAAPFAEKLNLVLKALSISRVRLAAELQVDKSLVSRWASGAVVPSEYNLEGLTRLVASRVPGFTMLDWDADRAALAQRLGVTLPDGGGTAAADAPMPLPFFEAARQTSAQRAVAYEGFWRTTRPSAVMPGAFRHEFGMFRRADNGLIRLRMGCAGYLGEGWILPIEGKLFTIVHDMVAQTPLFGVFNGVQQSRALSLNGLMLGAGLDAARTPTVYPTILERIGDLTGAAEADDAFCEELISRDPMAPEGAVPEDVAAYLTRDVGRTAAAAGGDLLMTAAVTAAFARGDIGLTFS